MVPGFDISMVICVLHELVNAGSSLVSLSQEETVRIEPTSYSLTQSSTDILKDAFIKSTRSTHYPFEGTEAENSHLRMAPHTSTFCVGFSVIDGTSPSPDRTIC